MNNAKSTVAAIGAIGAAATKIQKSVAAAGNVSVGVGDKTKTKRTYGGRGMGLMKRPNGRNGRNVGRSFGRGGKHKFSGKLRPRSPSSKPMRLSRRLSWKIQRGSPRSPISAVMLDWTPKTKHGDSKKHAQPVEEGNTKTPGTNDD